MGRLQAGGGDRQGMDGAVCRHGFSYVFEPVHLAPATVSSLNFTACPQIETWEELLRQTEQQWVDGYRKVGLLPEETAAAAGPEQQPGLAVAGASAAQAKQEQQQEVPASDTPTGVDLQQRCQLWNVVRGT